MEAPEKLYYGFNEQAHLEAYCPQKTKLCQIEYTRTDTFIEKASEWLRYNNDLIDGDVADYVEDFVNYMKGE